MVPLVFITLYHAFTKSYEIRNADYEFGRAYFIGLDFGGHYTIINLQGIIMSYCSSLGEHQADSYYYMIRLQHIRDIEDEK